MFENLSEKLQRVMKNLRGEGRLSAENMEVALREIRVALLEADVHFRVVKQLVENIRQKAVGEEVLAALSPSQQVVKIVNEELTKILGSHESRLRFSNAPPSAFLIVGLQGSGKTTTTGKLALWLSKNGHSPLMTSVDVYRPAAREQLRVLAGQLKLPLYAGAPEEKLPADLARSARREAANSGRDVLLVDTAGRLHIDEELMAELEELKRQLDPVEILFVADAMTGQDAVKSAEAFHKRLGITGVILTKMDGDARGGAALSVKVITGAPIYFVGTGEKVANLEVFHPERVAQRILGMGDVMSLIEKTQQVYDEKQAKKMAKKMKKADFTLDDFREQMQMMRQMGDMKDLLKMIPGMEQAMKKMGANTPDPDAELKRVEAIINSMTPYERANPKVLDNSRRQRVAKGCGRSLVEVNAFMKRFNDAQKMMKRMSKLGPGGLKNMMRGMGMR